jgi:hypothetical protein
MRMHNDSKNLQLLIKEIKACDIHAAAIEAETLKRSNQIKRIREIADLFLECKNMCPLSMRDALGCYHQHFKSFREVYHEEYREHSLVTGMIALLAPIVNLSFVPRTYLLM